MARRYWLRSEGWTVIRVPLLLLPVFGSQVIFADNFLPWCCLGCIHLPCCHYHEPPHVGHHRHQGLLIAFLGTGLLGFWCTEGAPLCWVLYRPLTMSWWLSSALVSGRVWSYVLLEFCTCFCRDGGLQTPAERVIPLSDLPILMLERIFQSTHLRLLRFF